MGCLKVNQGIQMGEDFTGLGAAAADHLHSSPYRQEGFQELWTVGFPWEVMDGNPPVGAPSLDVSEDRTSSRIAFPSVFFQGAKEIISGEIFYLVPGICKEGHWTVRLCKKASGGTSRMASS